MISLWIPLALMGAAKDIQTDYAVENLKNLKAVYFLVEPVTEEHGIPSHRDLMASIELELRSKNIPIVSLGVAMKRYSNGSEQMKPDIYAYLYININSSELKHAPGYCFNISMRATVSNPLPHNPKGDAETLLWEKNTLYVLDKKDPIQIESWVLAKVKDFELKWLKAHEPAKGSGDKVKSQTWLRSPQCLF